MENSLAVANYFIRKSKETGEELTPMKLIKIVYIANGWYLALTEKALIDEKIEAWKYGPVVPNVYKEFKMYSKGQVSCEYADLSGNTPVPADPQIMKFLNRIWEVYGKYDGLQLSALTHQKNTPWDIVWNEQGGNRYNAAIINNDLMRKHYTSKLNAVPNGVPAP